MRTAPALIALLLVAACGGGPRSPFLRVMADNGRVYYAHKELILDSRAGGFITFRDLVTHEDVHLKAGTFRALECPPEELDVRQREYIDDPSKKPMVSDYEAE